MKSLLLIGTMCFTPVNLYAKTIHLHVTATAYNSVPNQTDATPDVAAWGDVLRDDVKAVAVSKDLRKNYGFSRGDKIKIKGFEGEYVILDKMHPRWKNKIDIFMGKNVHAAKQWGRKRVVIMFER